ncbi:hypothetical protein B9G98_00584 [Wickerhamiella sorbophila]|uniref:Uncharacterized protein n=1 Tax=Wickerhamiella sorbophila TaxID=45607 RepID=A0A2T0FD92_9ASCO|nr:hypothetical protein B9G98_00584 [Wickerhamiella sorbophila]PRT52964.1 hypothetical protein B9G98_00584 [Wickerhamiella sorbophila]
MKLLERSVKPLSKLEKSIYRPLLAPVEKVSKRAIFLSFSDNYQTGDENVLPYPERSKKGIWMQAMTQNVAKSQLMIVLNPTNPEMIRFAQEKIRKLHEIRVFSCSRDELQASIFGRSASPFDYWRAHKPELIPNTPETSLVAIDPPLALLTASEEYSLAGALLQSEVDVDEYIRQLSASQTYSHELLHMKTLAGLGLTKVTAIENGIYLSHP